jgi:hypothetical protein
MAHRRAPREPSSSDPGHAREAEALGSRPRGADDAWVEEGVAEGGHIRTSPICPRNAAVASPYVPPKDMARAVVSISEVAWTPPDRPAPRP